MKLVECVPNVSEGRRPEVYAAIAAAAGSVPGVTVLDVDPGAETNRTVCLLYTSFDVARRRDDSSLRRGDRGLEGVRLRLSDEDGDQGRAVDDHFGSCLFIHI